jgi:glutamate dehydrogenase/leucine dehydrogenase
MVKSFSDAKIFSDKKNISMRDACFAIAVERILKAMKLKGQV